MGSQLQFVVISSVRSMSVRAERMSPSGWKDDRDGGDLHSQQSRRGPGSGRHDDYRYYESWTRSRDPRVGGRYDRRSGGGSDFKSRDGGEWKKRKPSGSDYDQLLSTYKDGVVRDTNKGGSSYGLGDHCRDKSGSRSNRERETWVASPHKTTPTVLPVK